MVDWQEIVRGVGRSRTDFTISERDEMLACSKVIRLTCNCCSAWVERRINYETLERVYYPDHVLADTVEYLVRFMLNVNTGGLNADRRTIARSC